MGQCFRHIVLVSMDFSRPARSECPHHAIRTTHVPFRIRVRLCELRRSSQLAEAYASSYLIVVMMHYGCAPCKVGSVNDTTNGNQISWSTGFSCELEGQSQIISQQSGTSSLWQTSSLPYAPIFFSFFFEQSAPNEKI